MNFFQLECFILAVEKESFAEVASAMHVTQPTITYQITNLEEELEEKLFLRTKRGVEVTREGKIFYENAKDILDHYHLALSHFKHAISAKENVIRLGFTRPPDNYDIFSAIHRYRAEHPDTIIDVHQDEIIADTPDRKIDQFDILFHYRHNQEDFSDYWFYSLGRCPYYVLVSQYSPLASKDALTIEELKGYRFLTVDEYKNTQFQVPNLHELKKNGIECSFYSTLEQMLYAVADGIGFGIYPTKYREVKAGFKRIPFISQDPLEYGLLYHKDHSSEVENFLQFLIKELKEENLY